MNASIREVGNGSGPGETPGLFEVLKREVGLRNYSQKTFKSYSSHLRAFVGYFAPRHPKDLSEADVRKYLIHLIEGKHFSAGSVGQVLSALKFLYSELYGRPFVIAGIAKRVSIHSLRHAFATHLLEQGTDIKLIQELLGHSSVRTTEIYTHVSSRAIGQIVNPIDKLFPKRQEI